MSVCLTYEGGLYVLIILWIFAILLGIGLALTSERYTNEENEVTKRDGSHDKGGNKAKT